MAARIRHLIAWVSMFMLAGVAGMVALAPAASAAPRPVMAGSATPGVPTSTVGVEGEHFVRYCVKNYAPNSTVIVTNEATGATRTIHTNQKGSGCAKVPIKSSCRATRQVIIAVGTDADGNPASSRAVVTSPPNRSLCSAGAAKGQSSGSGSGSSPASGSLAFTGASGILFMVLLGIVLIMLGTSAVAAARRRGQVNVG